ncbi:MAG: hypothetical protein L3J39_00260 [Verrucomicrobiales bacterium]|nr:hypothetical protein [Verrucomicrobiales bacterium]
MNLHHLLTKLPAILALSCIYFQCIYVNAVAQKSQIVGSVQNFTLTLSTDEVGDELDAALDSLALPIYRGSSENSAFSVIIGVGGKSNFKFLNKVKPSGSSEAYQVIHAASGELGLVAQTQHGLANGIYDLRRAILLASPEVKSPSQLLKQGEQAPHFKQRIFYHFMTTWNLQRLTVDTFTMKQWKVHLDRMRALNANQFYFDIWADQYFHPDYPETFKNKAQYDKLREVCDYAHKIGLRTGVVIFPAQIPASVYLAYPEDQAVEAANYHGINMCPSRAWDRVVSFDTFMLSYFGSRLDDVIVEMQDPGSCLCEQCCKQFPELVKKFVKAYRDVPGGPADRKIELCTLHFRDWLEEPKGKFLDRIAAPIMGLRDKVFSTLPKGTTLLDIDNATMDLGREKYGLENTYFFFDLDPESGIEDAQVFPRVKLKRIEAQIADSVKRGHHGILAYRMMPFAQHVADYLLFRKCWDPSIETNVAMTELAAEWGISHDKRAIFVQAMRDIDKWWEKKDLQSLDAAESALCELTKEKNSSAHLKDLKDLVLVLKVLAHYSKENKSSVAKADFYPPAGLVKEVRALMIDSRIFEAYTVHQHWEIRSREMIGQRMRWWLKVISR